MDDFGALLGLDFRLFILFATQYQFGALDRPHAMRGFHRRAKAPARQHAKGQDGRHDVYKFFAKPQPDASVATCNYQPAIVPFIQVGSRLSRILVTGASGFIGRATVAALSANGHDVRAAMRRKPYPTLCDGVEAVFHPDFDVSFDWTPLVAGCNAVVHLAGIAHPTRRTPESLYDSINHLATAALATAAARAGVERFVFVSSIRAQNGPAADHALTERDAANPTDAFGRSKLAAEHAVRASGAPFTILRPVRVYGAGVTGSFALLLRAAASRWPLPVKEFANRRSLLSIDNLVSALAFTISAPAAAGETYVVADPGSAMRVSDVIATLRQAQGRRPLFLSIPLHYLEIPLRLLRRGELWDRFGGNLRVDPAKLLAAGWRAGTDTRAGLVAMAQAASPRKSGTASRSTQ